MTTVKLSDEFLTPRIAPAIEEAKSAVDHWMRYVPRRENKDMVERELWSAREKWQTLLSIQMLLNAGGEAFDVDVNIASSMLKFPFTEDL